jgi:hypothetical protein
VAETLEAREAAAEAKGVFAMPPLLVDETPPRPDFFDDLEEETVPDLDFADFADLLDMADLAVPIQLLASSFAFLSPSLSFLSPSFPFLSPSLSFAFLSTGTGFAIAFLSVCLMLGRLTSFAPPPQIVGLAGVAAVVRMSGVEAAARVR